MHSEKSLSQILERLEKLKSTLARDYSVSSIGIFGSYIRHEQRPDSDLDLLVTFENPPGLFKYIELENYLSDSLGVKVDLVMKNALKPSIKERVLEEVQMV